MAHAGSTNHRHSSTPPHHPPRACPKKMPCCVAPAPGNMVTNERHASKALYGDPGPLFLTLGLPDAGDCRPAIRGDPQLQETRGNLLPMSSKSSPAHAHPRDLL